MATTKARAACLLLVWALVAADLLGTGLARASLGKEQREFDYFALALQWPGTICPSTRYCCAINGCCRYVLARPSSSPSLSPHHRRPSHSRPFGSRSGGVSGAPEIRFDSILGLCALLLTPLASLVPLCRPEPLQTFTIRKCPTTVILHLISCFQ
jgi:hypothetical protein